MKAGEVVFQQLLDGKIQYRVPLFQRTYSWEEEDWQCLWDDLLDIYDLARPRSHFIGAVVTLPIPDSPERCSKFMLIDGQQRLATLFVLLAVIRDLAKSHGDETLATEIHEDCLINRFAREPDEYRKMKPTKADLAAFNAIIDGQSSDGTLIGQARAFFDKALGQGDLEGRPIDLVKMKSCITDYLDLVSIRLDQDDSPHRIFESLNNTGQPLTASDLIRNYIFMTIPTEQEQESSYSRYWFPMQQRLGKELSPFAWRYLMKDGSLLRYDDVYEEMRDLIATGNRTVVQVLENLNLYSQYYCRFWRPDPHEDNFPVRVQLQRLNDWEVEVAYPFLLTAMHKRATRVIDDQALLQVLQMIESYIVRRSICGIPTNRLRRVFALMSNQVSDNGFVGSCKGYLGENEWPTDDRFHEIFQTARIYIQSRLARARLILASLEESFEHHEPIEITAKITIEHLMPQTLNDEWRQELGPEFYRTHEELLHSIGNLTFSGYNPDMGNKPFGYKKQILAQSHFELNRSILSASRWTEQDIRDRAKELADRAVQIWRRPAVV
jgi:hypothetical protein